MEKFTPAKGHSRVAETAIDEEDGDKIEWMAAGLKRMTSIDPMTIDQTTVTDVPACTHQSYYMAAVRIMNSNGIPFETDRPLVLGQYAGAVDVQVIHSRRTDSYGRPLGWHISVPNHYPFSNRLFQPTDTGSSKFLLQPRLPMRFR